VADTKMPGRSGDVRPTNLSTSFSREKKRKEETWEKREQDLRQKRKKQDRESAMALTLPRESI